jgi:hypothetical protein
MLARDLDAPPKTTRLVHNGQHNETNTNTTLASQVAVQRITACCTGREPEPPKATQDLHLTNPPKTDAWSHPLITPCPVSA